MYWKNFIQWTNENSGFLSLILFVITIVFGWITGIFNSLIKRPKLKVRFIEKACFYSFFNTGNSFEHPESKARYDLHKSGFAVYMTIANVGNMPTSFDKIYLGYYRNSSKFKLFDRQMNWLAQWHSFEHFKLVFEDHMIVIPPLRSKMEYYMDTDHESLDVGKSVTGVAYFEESEAWGNFSPKTIDETGTIKMKIRIRDVYGKKFHFKTTLKVKAIEEAREINSTFGNMESLTK